MFLTYVLCVFIGALALQCIIFNCTEPLREVLCPRTPSLAVFSAGIATIGCISIVAFFLILVPWPSQADTCTGMQTADCDEASGCEWRRVNGRPNTESCQSLEGIDFACGLGLFVHGALAALFIGLWCYSRRDRVTPFGFARSKLEAPVEILGATLGPVPYRAACKLCGGSGMRGLFGPVGFGFFAGACPECHGVGSLIRVGGPDGDIAMNDEGALVVVSESQFYDPGCEGKYYCGRFLGKERIPGSDGRCGWHTGPQCPSCQRLQQSGLQTPARV